MPSDASELVACTSDDEWDALVRSSPQGSVFLSSEFLAALPATFERWFFQDGGSTLAGAVVAVSDDGDVLAAPLPFTLYQGVLVDGSISEGQAHRRVARVMRAVAGMVERLSAQRADLSFCLHPTMVDLRPLLWFNYGDASAPQFDVHLRYTGHVDVTRWEGTEAYLGTIRETRRQEYRRARRDGLNVACSDDLDLLEALYVKTFDRQSITVPPASLATVRSIAEAALGGGFGELLVCRSETGDALSALLALHDDRAAYYLVLGNDPDRRSSGNGTFLMVEFIARAAAQGRAYVDVCGMNSPNRGDFKASFNAEPVPYHVATLVWP